MHIVRLIECFDPENKGGLVPNAHYISKAQIREGHLVDIFSFTNGIPKTETFDSIRVHYISRPRVVRTFGGVSFFKAITKANIKPDIIHCIGSIPFGWLLPLAKRNTQAKLILSIHGSVMPLQKEQILDVRSTLNAFEYAQLITFLAKRVDLILPIAEFIKDELISLHIPKEKIAVIHTGINVELFNKKVAQPDSKHFTLLYVGRFAQKKGLPYLLRALASINDQSIRLKLVGGAPRDNDFHNVISLIKKLSLEKRVDVMPPIKHTELPSIYQSANIFILPSVLEPMGKVVLEALASSLPVIVTKQGGVTEIVENKVNGTIVPPQNPQALADAIIALKNNPTLQQKQIKNGTETAKKHDWSIIANNYSNAFSALL
ncbi:glycosyltransferase family 4 protein [Patescibacteria group bacterium]|nr:glycosyltransferase family 4 protein [Patescibacteria group bacterium]